MKLVAYPVIALALLAFAAPASACPWMKDKQQTTEKPKEQVEDQTS